MVYIKHVAAKNAQIQCESSKQPYPIYNTQKRAAPSVEHVSEKTKSQVAQGFLRVKRNRQQPLLKNLTVADFSILKQKNFTRRSLAQRT